MANNKNKDLDELSLLEQERLKDEAEKAKKEKKDKLEKKKREKDKINKLKKLEKKENRRIKKAINFPYKLLFRISSLFTLLFFILTFFYIQVDIYKAIFYTFWVFFALWGGGGVIMASIYYMISVDKEQELKEQKVLDVKLAEEEKIRLEEEELMDIQELEQHISKEKYTDLPRAKELTMGEDGEIKNNDLSDEEQNDSIEDTKIENVSANEPQRVLGGEIPSSLPEFSFSDNIDVADLDLLADEIPSSTIDFNKEAISNISEEDNTELSMDNVENNKSESEMAKKNDEKEYIDNIFGD